MAGFSRQTDAIWLVALTLVAALFCAGQAAAQAPPAAAPATASDGALKARVESLEEQLVDMQVMVGTLESLSRQGGGATAAPFPQSGSIGGGADAGRIDALETQIRALTAQVQQLSDQVRSLGGTPRRSELAPSTGNADVGGDFGSTTVATASHNDPIGGLLENAPVGQTAAAEPPPGSTFGGQPPPVATAALPAADAGDPKKLYESAYGYLLQRDYGAAETAFDDFLQKFPNDSLAGSAQYWLGESHFVRGQYKAAASAFLKGYQNYGQGSKAPDSLLKLAMSLDRLGQKDAACSSYSELSSKFPNAPQSVMARAKSERQRVGCP